MSEGVRVELPPGCEGIDTPDKSRAYSGRRGEAAYVDDAGYAHALKAAGLRILPSKQIGVGGGPAMSPCACGATRFPWQDVCGTCYANQGDE